MYVEPNGERPLLAIRPHHLSALGDKTPATVVIYQPTNLTETPAQALAGATISQAEFALVNQAGGNVNCSGDDWKLVLEIKHSVLPACY